jgi:hypothetical protein
MLPPNAETGAQSLENEKRTQQKSENAEEAATDYFLRNHKRMS